MVAVVWTLNHSLAYTQLHDSYQKGFVPVDCEWQNTRRVPSLIVRQSDHGWIGFFQTVLITSVTRTIRSTKSTTGTSLFTLVFSPYQLVPNYNRTVPKDKQLKEPRCCWCFGYNPSSPKLDMSCPVLLDVSLIQSVSAWCIYTPETVFLRIFSISLCQ